MCTILVLSGTTSRSLECSRIGGESTSGKNGPIRIEDEDFFSTLEAKHSRSKNTKKLKRENVESSNRWSILEQLSNIRGVSRATRTEHVYIFNRTVRSTGSLTFFQENGKWEWLVLLIIQILDQLPLIFGEKQPHMNNIKSFRQGLQWPNGVRLTLLARGRRSSVSAYH